MVVGRGRGTAGGRGERVKRHKKKKERERERKERNDQLATVTNELGGVISGPSIKIIEKFFPRL